MPSSNEVLGIGTPCLDYILQVEEAFLSKLVIPEEGMVSIDHASFIRLLADCPASPLRLLGGSSMNTIRGLAALGHSCSFWGTVGEDPLGSYIEKELSKKGITPHFLRSKTPTTQIAVLVTPDGKRTFCTYRGAGAEADVEELGEEFFEDARLVHIEGYSLSDSSFTEEVITKIKKRKVQVSLDLGSFNLVQKYKEKLFLILRLGIDVLFSNAQEVAMLSQKNPKEGCDFLRSYVPINVVLMGVEGCWVGDSNGLTHCPAYPVSAADTTGAGDLFASGFLHGLLRGESLTQSAHYGALLGAAVVQYQGADIPERHWEELRKMILS